MRIELEGTCYHIISPDNNRGLILKTKEDHQDFLELLEQLLDRYLIIIYAQAKKRPPKWLYCEPILSLYEKAEIRIRHIVIKIKNILMRMSLFGKI